MKNTICIDDINPLTLQISISLKNCQKVRGGKQMVVSVFRLFAESRNYGKKKTVKIVQAQISIDLKTS